jgi:hypothetical protein
MTIPSIKQSYLVLRALADQGTPLEIHELVASMKRLSLEKFGGSGGNTALFVYNPAPLSDVIKEMSRSGDVEIYENRFVLTEQGKDELANTEPLIAAGT